MSDKMLIDTAVVQQALGAVKKAAETTYSDTLFAQFKEVAATLSAALAALQQTAPIPEGNREPAPAPNQHPGEHRMRPAGEQDRAIYQAMADNYNMQPPASTPQACQCTQGQVCSVCDPLIPSESSTA